MYSYDYPLISMATLACIVETLKISFLVKNTTLLKTLNNLNKEY